jgi:hypothetical protein
MSERFEKKFDLKVSKVDDEMGLVYGKAIISTIDGEPYFDLQGDHIPPSVMMRAGADFMKNSRVGGVMHICDDEGNIIKIGDVVFAMPMTNEIAKSMGMTTEDESLLIAFAPEDEEVLEMAREGVLGGFSIGGSILESEDVDSEAEDD